MFKSGMNSAVHARVPLLASLCSTRADLGGYEVADYFCHVVNLLGGKTGISAEEKSMVHDAIRLRQLTRATHAIWSIFFQLHEGGLSYEVAAKEHTVTNLIFIEVTNKLRAGEGSAILESDLEAKPRTVGATTSVVPGEVRVRIQVTGVSCQI